MVGRAERRFWGTHLAAATRPRPRYDAWGAWTRNLHPHSEIGERPGAASPPWDPASPKCSLLRERTVFGLSWFLKGVVGNEKKGAAGEEPPE